MGRIRTIKPEFPLSESMGRVSREARYCFILLWTIADDSGRIRANSRVLASLLYPFDDDAKNHIDSWLKELDDEGCIIVYNVDNVQHVQITKWTQHQKIERPTPSRLPDVSQGVRRFGESSPNPLRVLGVPTLDHGPRTKDLKEGSGPPKTADSTPSAASPPATSGINPTENTTDLGLFWCFRTRAIGRKPTAKEVTSALDAMIAAGSITLDAIRAEWTADRFDWSQTFPTWRTSVQKAAEQALKRAPPNLHNGKPITVRGGPEIPGEQFNPFPNRCIDDYEADHANFDPQTGKFWLWLKTCKNPKCQRKECVEARRQGA